MRCFVCVDFPEEVIKEISRVQEELEKIKFIGKVTELENLHLTLKFLGEISEDKMGEVKERLRKIKFKNLSLKLGRLGIFSFKGNPRVVWIKVEGEDIYDLQKRIDESLKDLFKIEEGFSAHVTIARIKYVRDKAAFKGHVENMGIKKIEFDIPNFVFKKSELKPLGPVYSMLEDYRSV